MGNVIKRADFDVIVKTGDVKGAGTDANVYCALIDDEGKRSRDIKLDCTWRNDFEKGSIDHFKVINESTLTNIVKVELWRDSKGLADDWYVEFVKIRRKHHGKGLNSEPEVDVPFPVNRWIHANKRYILLKYDSVLPQFDERKSQREAELEQKKKTYAFGEKIEGVPRRVKECPKDENFSNDYQWDIIGRKMKFLAQKKLTELFSGGKWKSLGDLLDVYKGSFGVPYGYYKWRSDENFGKQRLRGCSPTEFELCTNIPKNFAVTDEMVAPFIDGLTIQEAIVKKILYIVDLSILDGIKCKNDRTICAPMALFREKEGELLPIAIQLKQQPNEDNPVFLPSDPEYTWMLAKMHFNNAECCLHQTCTHLGFTHLVCESICVCVHNSLSPSHPVFRLLAPHFLYLIAINSLAVERLLSEDGWIDVTMTMGVCGLYEILERRWKNWRFDTNAWLPNELKSRGVNDTSRLEGYVYRNDALLLHGAILNYVTDVLSFVYVSYQLDLDAQEKLKEDQEIQNFAALLVDEENGVGIKGVFGNGKFDTLEDLIKVVSGTIFLGSVAHAAANFCQYDEYAFPANYPATLNGKPPSNKSELTEKDVLAQLPDKEMTLSIMVVTKILSDRGTNGLGDFEVQYQYEPHAVEAVKRFRANLREISNKIKERNSSIKEPYPYLDPDEVPNAISI